MYEWSPDGPNESKAICTFYMDEYNYDESSTSMKYKWKSISVEVITTFNTFTDLCLYFSICEFKSHTAHYESVMMLN